MDNFNLPPGVSVMDKHINPIEIYDFEDTTCQTWFERDRQHVCLVDKETEQKTVIEFWDDSVTDMVDSGFLDPRDWHKSLYDYYLYINQS